MSPAFRTVMADGPLRLVVIGAGGMGRAWLETISRSSEAVLAGVADLDLRRRRQRPTHTGRQS